MSRPSNPVRLDRDASHFGQWSKEVQERVTKLGSKDQDAVSSFCTGPGTANSTSLHVAGALERAGVDEETARQEMQALYESFYPGDTRAIPRVIQKAYHPDGESEEVKRRWPQPDEVPLDIIEKFIANRGISPIGENDLPESPNGSGHDSSQFLRDFFHGVNQPIYVGNRYKGVIKPVRNFAGNPTKLKIFQYDQFLPNPMTRELTKEELEETCVDQDGKPKRKYGAGGRCLKFSSKTLGVILYESDSLPMGLQLATIRYLSGFLPLISIVWSGSRSYHAFFSLKGLTADDVHLVRRVFVNLGGDRGVMNPAHLARLGGVNRSDKTNNLQRVLWMDKKARHRNPEPRRVAELTAHILAPGRSFLDKLSSMIASTSEHIASMKEMAREAVFVLPEIAISGQMTLINASPNAGKTLLTLWSLSQRDEKARESQQVYYINADDNHPGSIEKMEVMTPFGVEFLIPGEKGFTIEQFRVLLNDAIDHGQAVGITFVLDTLKKFVSMMDKDAARALCGLMRRFVQAGGTIIALAHTNKHKIEGKSIAEGVGDFLNDFDAAYTIEIKSDGDEKTVVFHNTKSRGPNSKLVTFIYNGASKVTWPERFKSARLVDEGEALEMFDRIADEDQYETDLPAIQYILQRLAEKDLSRKEITQTDLVNDFSRKQREQVLSRYNQCNKNEAHRCWSVRRSGNGGQIYSLYSGKS